MEIRKAERKKAKIKMALKGGSGAGKTFSSLLIAFGITKDWNKVVVIDTEHSSADLYSNLGSFNVIALDAPHTPEKYIQALEIATNANMEVIIIDSISHCWDYLIELHAGMTGNSFTNWGKITPRQNTFINAILSTNAHIIATMRVKQDYILNQKDGKYVPEKVGLKAVQRDGVDYEFTLVLELDMNHKAKASKDRTNLFSGRNEFVITEQIGTKILDWCNANDYDDQIQQLIDDCSTVDDLLDLFNKYPSFQQTHQNAFAAKKQAIQSQQKPNNNINNYLNGNISIRR